MNLPAWTPTRVTMPVVTCGVVVWVVRELPARKLAGHAGAGYCDRPGKESSVRGATFWCRAPLFLPEGTGLWWFRGERAGRCADGAVARYGRCCRDHPVRVRTFDEPAGYVFKVARNERSKRQKAHQPRQGPRSRSTGDGAGRCR